MIEHTTELRVRYSETDAMGGYYNSRALEWFEVGRSELCRATGKPYRLWESEGVLLPVVEAYVKFLGRAEYDDLLRITTRVSWHGRVRMRFDVEIVRAADGAPVCRGHTIQAITDRSGRPRRPPDWVYDLMGRPEDE